MPLRPPSAPPDPLRLALQQWNVGTLAAQTLWTRGLGPEAVAAAARQRWSTLARHARTHSPFYRKRWRHLPPGEPALADVPVVGKDELMASFDAWCTDRAIAWRDVAAFVATRAHIGERFLGKYLVWTSSGTTGRPGVFVQDDAALAAYDALVSVQLGGATLGGCDWAAAVARGGRAALVAADCDHFASIASWRRVARGKPWLAMASFAVTLPIGEIVAGLNAYQPAFVAGYPTVLALLAAEQQAGRLAIRPVALWAGGEVLSPTTRAAIEHAFGCPLVNEYGASECLTIGYGCREGWLHVNADWVVLEPVDAHHRPTPPGELSHTALLTNLANAVQPVIRYDLADRVRVAPGRCACGDPLPAIQVEGRRDDVLVLTARDGTHVRLVPLALATVVETEAHVHRFQIVQRRADRLELRLAAAERAQAGAKAVAALRGYLARQGLPAVRVTLAETAPQQDPRDGKLRQVVGLPEQ
ncbi:MAG: AMP-binding protein [Burkholderiales bacterium]